MTDIKHGAEFVEAIAGLARPLVFDHPAGGRAVILPNGGVQHLAPIDAPMTHVKQSVAAFDATSFAAYVNRFKQTAPIIDDETAEVVKDEYAGITTIFADPNTSCLRAVIDYHEYDDPGRCAHSIRYDVPWSEQWGRWRAIDGKAMSQVDFAEFIEENLQDIVEPEGATFLDLVTGLQAKKRISFESGVRLQDGTNQLTYAEDVEAKGRGNLLVPSEFAIGAPIFFGGESYRVRCLLRYRIDEGRLIFIIKIHRRQFIEQTAFQHICQTVAEITGIPVLNAWA